MLYFNIMVNKLGLIYYPYLTIKEELKEIFLKVTKTLGHPQKQGLIKAQLYQHWGTNFESISFLLFVYQSKILWQYGTIQLNCF